MTDTVRYSFVIPVFNERDVLPLLFDRLDSLKQKLDGPTEFIFIDDGSKDGSLQIIQVKAKSDPIYTVLKLSRNFGHQVAITAGIDQAKGDAVIVIDADLQDPPEVSLQLIEKWKEGFAVVAAKRKSRAGESAFKVATAKIFYRFLSKLTPVQIEQDVGDFRLMDRRVVESFKSMRERDRFVRGMISWLGYTQTTVSYSREERAAGTTKYPLSKMLRLATNGIIGFSDIPLRAALWFGAAVSAMAIFYGLYVTAGWFFNDNLVEGWASTIVILSLLGGVNLMMIGVAGLYIGRIYEQVKNRPLYLLDDTEDADAQKPVNNLSDGGSSSGR